jgi:medium-chain acyl-[acyl-carrier-protein] hydrolase
MHSLVGDGRRVRCRGASTNAPFPTRRSTTSCWWADELRSKCRIGSVSGGHHDAWTTTKGRPYRIAVDLANRPLDDRAPAILLAFARALARWRRVSLLAVLYPDAPEFSRTWLACPRPRPDPTARLLCFHHAGGSPSAFRPWVDDLPAHVEMLVVRLPGREARLRETALTRVPDIVAPLAKAMAPLSEGIRVVGFGHSLGAMLAFEFARELRRQGLPSLAALVVSGRNAPGFGRQLSLHTLDDRELVAEVQRIYGGIPQAILDEPELLKLTLPVLRADLTLNETYILEPESPLDCPIEAYAGIDDPRVGAAGLEAWRQHTRASFEWAQVEGEHFYLSAPAGKRTILAKLAAVLGKA